MTNRSYQTFLLSDEPKILGVPITTGIPMLVLGGIGFLVGYLFQMFACGALLSFVMHRQFGGLPIRFFWATIYWSLPREMTVILFRAFPDSATRQYIR